MKHAYRIKKDVQTAWLAKPSTQRLLALEAGWMRSWLSQLRGQHMLYAGIDQDPKFLKDTRMQHPFRMGFHWQQGIIEADAFMQDAHWPFAQESLDVVVLQHALDMSSRPHQLIREASRTLVSGGYIVIVGFNPISWWGALRWTRNLSPKLPWASNPVSPMRLNDWLTLLDFRIEDTTSAAHVWPLKIGPESACRRVDRVMAGITIPPGNIHMVLARKTVAGMTTIRPRARVVAEPVSGLAVSTACSFEQVDSNK